MRAGERGIDRRAAAAVVLLIVVVGGVVAWRSSRSDGSDGCAVDAPSNQTDDLGAASPEAARIRWASVHDLGIDAEHPVLNGGDPNVVMADYELDAEHQIEAEEGHAVYLTIVTRLGDDGVWRVTRVGHCEQTVP